MAGIRRSDVDLIETALASTDLTSQTLQTAISLAKKMGKAEIILMVEKKAAALPFEALPTTVAIDLAVLRSYVGNNGDESSDVTLSFALKGDYLTVFVAGQAPRTLVALSPNTFRLADGPNLSVAFSGGGGLVERVVVTQNNQSQTFQRLTTPAGSGTATASPPPRAEAKPMDPTPSKPPVRTAARPWPGFRGSNAAGNGDAQGAVSEWNVEHRINIKWKTPIPGIANASPIVWGNRVFVTTAIISDGDKTFRTGLYGDVAPVDDVSEHTWKIYGLDKATGEIMWEQTVFTGIPKVKRHTKASQANSTPVTMALASSPFLAQLGSWPHGI